MPHIHLVDLVEVTHVLLHSICFLQLDVFNLQLLNFAILVLRHLVQAKLEITIFLLPFLQIVGVGLELRLVLILVQGSPILDSRWVLVCLLFLELALKTKLSSLQVVDDEQQLPHLLSLHFKLSLDVFVCREDRLLSFNCTLRSSRFLLAYFMFVACESIDLFVKSLDFFLQLLIFLGLFIGSLIFVAPLPLWRLASGSGEFLLQKVIATEKLLIAIHFFVEFDFNIEIVVEQLQKMSILLGVGQLVEGVGLESVPPR